MREEMSMPETVAIQLGGWAAVGASAALLSFTVPAAVRFFAGESEVAMAGFDGVMGLFGSVAGALPLLPGIVAILYSLSKHK